MENKKTKLTISATAKKSIRNIEIAKTQGKNSVLIEKSKNNFSKRAGSFKTSGTGVRSKTSSSFNRSIAIFLGSCLVPFFILIISFFLIGYESFANAIENLKNINNSGFTIVFVVVIMALALGTANFFLQYGGSKLLVKTTSLLMVIEIPVAIFSSALLTNKTTELSVFRRRVNSSNCNLGKF